MIYLKNWLKSILSFFVFLKFKDIWELKEYLESHHKESGILASIYSQYLDKKGSYIGIPAKFQNKPYFPHGMLGIFISDLTEIGKNAVIFQQVTIGAIRTKGSKNIGNPKIGDNCYIGAGAKILGNITIGNNCRIGANAVVTKDMEDNSVAYCSPTIIKKKQEKMDNRFYVLSEDNQSELYYEDGKFHQSSKD